MSSNLIKTLKGLETFVNLKELILDNNQLDDDVEFPSLDKLTTLSINKNKVN